MGLEAVLFGKPVVTLGNHFINDLSFVKRCDNMRDLPAIVKEQTERYTFNEDELLHFLGKIVENSAVVDLVSLWLTQHSKEERARGMEPLTQLFAKRVKLT